MSFGPARTVAAIAVALGISSLVYRLLHATDHSQSAALFIGIPSLMAFAAAYVAVCLHADSVIGITLKTITIGLLLAGPFLGEGFICVLLAAPLFYAVGLLIAVVIELVRKFGRSRRHSGTLGLLVLPMLAFSLEGVVPALTVPRQETSVAERTLVATPEMVEAALAQSPHFDAPLEGVLGIGFPRPATASGEMLLAMAVVLGAGRLARAHQNAQPVRRGVGCLPSRCPRLVAALAAIAGARPVAGHSAGRLGWQPAFDLLVPFSHWVTPTVLAARFDTWFFVAEMPPRQAALHDTIETSEGAWLTPARVLESDYHTVYATAQHLRRLSPYRTVADLLTFARKKAIRRIQPEVVEGGAGLSVLISPDLVDNW